MFVMVLTLLITVGVAYVLFLPSRWGKQVRAVVQNRVMAGAVGINTEKVDCYTFGDWLRHRWVLRAPPLQ